MSDGRADPPNVQLWGREGFAGPLSVSIRPTNGTEYISVQGPHAPRRVVLDHMSPRDQIDPDALPSVVAASKIGVRLLVSGRAQPMSFVVRNVDADEIHFIQSGEAKFETDVGSLKAGEGDFVCIPRSVSYRVRPTSRAVRSLIVESPSAFQLIPPRPAGMINFARDLHYAEVDHDPPPTSGPTRVLLKSSDGGDTTYLLPHDPISLGERMPGSVPVWKLNLANIQVLTYLPEGGPPSPFLFSHSGDILMFNLSARPGGRAPIHINADFDELVHYVRGPGAWGRCTEPGTLTWVPKGVVHHGPSEDVPEGYAAWLLETRATLRWDPVAVSASELMETEQYARHPAWQADVDEDHWMSPEGPEAACAAATLAREARGRYAK
jgi:homogentisate 1,2-dioxygenase